MVWFTFTFLLGIFNRDDDGKDEKLKKKESKSETEKNYIETEVSKPNFTCHIEYVLFPNQSPKFIDVVAWDHAAKIYSENSTSAIIPVVTKHLRWIHFRVNHKINLKTKDVQTFLSHNVKFTMTLGNKNFGEAAKSDKTKKFFGPKFSEIENDYFIKKQFFQPLSETLEDLQSVSFLKEHLTPRQQLYISLDTTLETSENCDKLLKTLKDLSDEYHDERYIKTPTPPYQEIPPLINIFAQKHSEEFVSGKKGKEKPTAETKQKEPANRKIEFSITGEEFFSGKKTFENCLKYNFEELPFIFSISSVKNLLSRKQVELFNPLTITLSRVNYLPAEELAGKGVSHLKFQYLLCNQFLVESHLIPISTQLQLNYTRTILTNEIDKNQLMQFIQTGGLKIQILGKFSEEENQNLYKENLYTKNLLKSIVSKNNEHLKKKLVLLGTVVLDISSILFQPHKLRMKCPFQLCFHETFPSQNSLNFTPKNVLCTNEKKNLNCFDSNFSDPVLTVMVTLGHHLLNFNSSPATNSIVYNRLFGVFYDANIAISVIKIIQSEVVEFLEPVEYFKNGKNVQRPKLEKILSNPLYNKNSKITTMTGFLVDSIDKIIIYVESSTLGGIQQIWALTSCISPNQGHILYDSSLNFCERLYKSFFKFGGILTLKLNKTIQTDFKHSGKCKRNFYSASSKEALKCLSSLIGCKSMKTATLHDFFPQSDCLISLAEESGLPVHICEKSEFIN